MPFVHSDPVLTWQITQSKGVASVRWTWLVNDEERTSLLFELLPYFFTAEEVKNEEKRFWLQFDEKWRSIKCPFFL